MRQGLAVDHSPLNLRMKLVKNQEIGHEYGATTGRKRRCGWIDLPQLKYSIMINGVTEIALTKLDILNSFDEIEVCTAYEHNDGRITDQLPYDLVNIRVRPKFEKFKGWNSDISGIRKEQNFLLMLLIMLKCLKRS